MKLHEPEFVGDARNAVGYFLVLGMVSCGTVLILVGLFAPFFLTKALDYADELASENVTPTEAYVKAEKYRKIAFVIVLTWFVLSWLFVIAAYYMNGGI